MKSMQTKKKYIWEVVPTTTPIYMRRCSKCKSMMPYYCSEKFRINAQKKILDVWLIYKCIKCDNTCNIDVLRRISPQSIDKNLYKKFQDNDVKISWNYAFDSEVIRINKIDVDYSNVGFNTHGDEISLEEMKDLDVDVIEIDISQSYDMDIRLTNVIRKNFKISSNQLEWLFSSGTITVFPLGPVKKRKLVGENKIIFNLQKLRKFLRLEDSNVNNKGDCNKVISTMEL